MATKSSSKFGSTRIVSSETSRLTFDEVVEAVAANNRNVGGGTIVEKKRLQLVQGVGVYREHPANREHCHHG